MPIDPQSGLDPETGMVGLRETHQPTGALGAVMSLLNGQKSREISQALQQHRAAQAQMAQQEQEAEAAKIAREQQVRDAIARLPMGADQDTVIGTGLRNGMDVERVLPWMRAKAAAGGKVDAARVKAGADMFTQLTTKAGQPPNQALGFLSSVYSPEEIDAIKAQVGSAGDQSLPVPGSKVTRNESAAALDDTKAADIDATQDSRIALNRSKADTDRLLKQAALERVRRGGTHQKSTALAIEGLIARLGKNINDAEERVDPLTLRKGPRDRTQVDAWKAQKARLEAELAAADEDDDDSDANLAAATQPGAAKGTPDPFRDSVYLKGKGATSAPPAPAGGKTVSITLPPLPK